MTLLLEVRRRRAAQCRRWSCAHGAALLGALLGTTLATPAPGEQVAEPPAEQTAEFAPYAQRLPGSDVSFQLVPIQGGVLRKPIGDEGATADVQIAPFWMGQHEVTWAEYWQYMELCTAFEKFDDAGVRRLADKHGFDALTAPSKLYEPSFTYTPGDEPDQPAVSMTQFAAKQYTKWLSLTTGVFYRLPTDAEWEYACRAGTQTAYNFGDDPSAMDDYGWHYDIADDMTHPVGEKEPNAWGLYDMHGNACEWVLDEYREDWYEQFAGRTVTAAEALCWPERLFPRVLRGGSWWTDPSECRSDSRRPSDDENWKGYDPNSPKSPWWFASDEAQDIGFRVVRPVEPPPRETWTKYWDADLPELREVIDHRIDKEGRGRRGLVDPELPEAVQALSK